MSIKVELKCMEHPEYQAKREPKVECDACMYMYGVMVDAEEIMIYGLDIQRVEK